MTISLCRKFELATTVAALIVLAMPRMVSKCCVMWRFTSPPDATCVSLVCFAHAARTEDAVLVAPAACSDRTTVRTSCFSMAYSLLPREHVRVGRQRTRLRVEDESIQRFTCMYDTWPEYRATLSRCWRTKFVMASRNLGNMFVSRKTEINKKQHQCRACSLVCCRARMACSR